MYWWVLTPKFAKADLWLQVWHWVRRIQSRYSEYQLRSWKHQLRNFTDEIIWIKCISKTSKLLLWTSKLIFTWEMLDLIMQLNFLWIHSIVLQKLEIFYHSIHKFLMELWKIYIIRQFHSFLDHNLLFIYYISENQSLSR